MKELNHENIKGLSMNDLETVSGGNYYEPLMPDFPDTVCPSCATEGMYIDGKRKDLIYCNCCGYTYYHNEGRELVYFGRFLG